MAWVARSDAGKKPAYIIVYDDTPDGLAQGVGEWLDKGYVPLGGMQFGVQIFSDETTEPRYFQTLVANGVGNE